MSDNVNSPAVFIIGAAKSGTTSLAGLLSTHPGLDIGAKKEPEYFSFYFERGRKWYLDQYANQSKTGKILIDASTGYTRYPQYPEVAERLYDFEPNAKLIYLMRHPIDRAFSHYVHRFTKELRKDEPINVTFEEHVKSDSVCIDSSDYKMQLEQYLKYFSSDQLLLLFTQDLKSNPQYVMDKVCRFIGVNTFLIDLGDSGRKNQTDSYLESRIRVQLTNRLKKIPGAEVLISIVPKSVKERIYGLVRRSHFAKSSQDKFDPKPLQTSTRKELVSRFRESNDWIGKWCKRDLSDWND